MKLLNNVPVGIGGGLPAMAASS